MKETKTKIKKITDDYIRMFASEHEQVKAIVANHRSGMDDQDFGTTIDSKHMRALYEISETLSTMLTMSLTEEELVWFKSLEGGRWFALNFPVYALPGKI
jgi:hypothetical protein